MKVEPIQVGDVRIAEDAPLAIIAGPCTAESLELCLRVGQAMRDRCRELGLGYIFKASFDKANRSSVSSPRGPGLDRGLDWIHQVGEKLGVPTTTDVHESHQAQATAQAVDMLQIPAFLCRQTDLLSAAALTGKPVNVKKGQFLSPGEMQHAIVKITQALEGSGATPQIMLTERGTSFGYHRLINDFIGLGDMLDMGRPVCFDVTHSTQQPGESNTTGGRPERAPQLARCAVVSGVHALFIETHPDPPSAVSDAATMLPLPVAEKLLGDVAALHKLTRELGGA